MSLDFLPTASGVRQLFPGLWEWSAFSPGHKVTLTSHSLLTSSGLVVIDPIPLDDLTLLPPARAVVLTNANHARAARLWQPAATIYAATGDFPAELQVHLLPDGDSVWMSLEIYALTGGPAGEVALFDPAQKLIVFGDAVVNLPERGLEILPAKYCLDQSQLRESVRNLLHIDFERAVFAHGDSMMRQARDQIRRMLGA